MNTSTTRPFAAASMLVSRNRGSTAEAHQVHVHDETKQTQDQARWKVAITRGRKRTSRHFPFANLGRRTFNRDRLGVRPDHRKGRSTLSTAITNLNNRMNGTNVGIDDEDGMGWRMRKKRKLTSEARRSRAREVDGERESLSPANTDAVDNVEGSQR